jgi:hypothetical protein
MPRNNAETELAQLVAAIRRTSRRQRLLSATVTSLLWGTLLASLMVLASRLGWLPVTPLLASAACVGSVLLVAILAATWRAPSTLSLLLTMEHKLQLKQQVSTAWEQHVAAPGNMLSKRLAERANKLRLTHRITGVWPSTLPGSARWIPGGLALLALCWIIALPERAAPSSQTDTMLSSAAPDNLARAQTPKRQWALLPPPQSPRPARTIADSNDANREPGHAGVTNRRQTLARLGPANESLEAGRRQALREGTQVNVGPASQQRHPQGMAARAGLAMQRLLALARSGALDGGRMNAADRQTLESLGIKPEALEAALRDSAAGKSEAIQRLLEQAAERLNQSRAVAQLAQGNAADAARNSQARTRSRGKTGQRTGRGAGPGADLAGAGGTIDVDDSVDAGTFDDIDGQAGAASSAFDDRALGGRGGAGNGSNTAAGAQNNPDGRSARLLLQAFGAPQAGVVYRSTGLALPDANQAQLDSPGSIAAQFKYQVERTFARADVDARHRALVRRYFVVLKQRLNAQPLAARTPQ